MKKLLTLLVVMLLGVGLSMARDKVTTDTSVLPKNARELINKHFGKVGVNHIKIDKNMVGHIDDYDVILNNGTEIEFKADGTLKSIDCGSKSIPDALVIKPIRDYIKKNFKGSAIVGLEIERNSYEIELANGLDLKFDRAGNFLKVDN